MRDVNAAADEAGVWLLNPNEHVAVERRGGGADKALIVEVWRLRGRE